MGKQGLKILSVVLIVFAAISVSYAQFAIPVSDTIVTGSLMSAGQDLAHFQVREGTMLTIRNDEQGFWYGLVPKVDEAKHVWIKGVKLIPQAGAPRVEEILKRMDIPAGDEVQLPFLAGDQSISVKIEETEKGVFPTIPSIKNPRDISSINPEHLQKLYGASGGGLCSLTCDSLTITSTAVRMSCGVCRGAR